MRHLHRILLLWAQCSSAKELQQHRGEQAHSARVNLDPDLDRFDHRSEQLCHVGGDIVGYLALSCPPPCHSLEMPFVAACALEIQCREIPHLEISHLEIPHRASCRVREGLACALARGVEAVEVVEGLE